jgi:predicted pyridoxine 5'-phosphate oxidase superfamily flavin-nucleotide-binding protein
MKKPVSDIAFTAAVKSIQHRLGSRQNYERMEHNHDWKQTVTPMLATFLSGLDTFFLGTSNADGQPYIQHRGGPPGFLKVMDERTLGFADFSGNRQYITTGNLQDNDKAFIFLIDFARRRRIKVWGRAEVIEDNPEVLNLLTDPEYGAAPERAIVFHIDAWDINCPQHITRRYTVEEFKESHSGDAVGPP